jgi:hypothetical protein
MRYAAERRSLDESIAELREIADGHDEVLAEAAGITAGSWYAWPSTHVGHELVAAGLLIMAGGHDGKPLDLKRWSGGRGWGLSGGRGSARANDNRRVRLIRLLAGDDRGPERTPRASARAQLQPSPDSECCQFDDGIRQKPHGVGDHFVKVGRAGDRRLGGPADHDRIGRVVAGFAKLNREVVVVDDAAR